MRPRLRLWLHGLVAATITGIATAVLAMASSPEVVAELGYMPIWKIAGGAALISVASYLKQSPLPPPPQPPKKDGISY